MATPLGTISYFSEEEVVAQSDTKLVGSIVESLSVEFDQERYVKFLSTGVASPKSAKRCRKVSTKTAQSQSLSLSQEDKPESSKKMRLASPVATPKASPTMTINFGGGYTLLTGDQSQSRQAKRNVDRRRRRKNQRVEKALRREAMESMEKPLQNWPSYGKRDDQQLQNQRDSQNALKQRN